MYRARSDERSPAIDGDLDGKATQGAAGEGDSGEQALAQRTKTPRRTARKRGRGGGTGGGTADYQAALRANDAHIAELQGVANADKTAEATDALNAEIAKLKKQMADERVQFALRAVGARPVKAAKALLAEHDDNVEALVKAEPWLFETKGSSQGGATGLDPAGASGSSDDQYMRRWERIAGFADEGKEG